MDDAHWHQLKDLFFQAIALSEDDRAAWLEQIDDAPLRAELEKLLADDSGASPLLDAPQEALAHLVEEAPEQPSVAAHIGPYRILRELGRGGMGTVYLAERDDGTFQHQVALKVIRRGLDTEDILHRFRTERQILASLTHPHIARILDGGSTDDGLPYFVMEYIEGAPITTHCDRQCLSVEERLALFSAVCQAVQYAHQNLVVHRDLKPSNMMVTTDGQVKLLDFGIAKLLGNGQHDAVQTQTGMRVLTPAYASPEQLKGGSISTASDVYALGLVLYEILAGQRPYTIPADQEALVFIDTVTPRRPSTAVAESGETETLSEARSTTPERLRRQLSGDLDTIVMKALRKEPERRYTSAEAFLDDIRRHLDGLPVGAQRDTLGYRMRKFVGRHRTGVIAASLVGLSLVGGLGGALWQAREKAQEAAKADAVKDFVLGLFEISDPNVSRGEEVTARQLLDQGRAQVANGLSDQPEVQAEMLMVLGDIYRKLGAFDDARPLVEQALALRRQTLGGAHPEVATSLNALAEVRYLQADYEESERLYREALQITRRAYGNRNLDVARTLNDLSVTLRARGAYDEADSLARQAVDLRRRLLGEEHADVAESLVNVGVVLYLQENYEEAERLYSEALATQERLLGPDHLTVAGTLNRLALLMRRRESYAEADSLYRQIIALYRRVYGEAHPQIATILNNQGFLAHYQGDHDRAESLAREALAMQEELIGPDHPDMAQTLENLGRFVKEQGQYDEAEHLYRRALEMNRRVLGEEHRSVGQNLGHLSSLLYEQRRFEEAEVVLRQAAAIAIKVYGDHHFVTLARRGRLAFTLRYRGRQRLEQGRFQDAEALLLESYALLKENEGTDEQLNEAREALAGLYTAWGRPEEAQAYQ